MSLEIQVYGEGIRENTGTVFVLEAMRKESRPDVGTAYDGSMNRTVKMHHFVYYHWETLDIEHYVSFFSRPSNISFGMDIPKPIRNEFNNLEDAQAALDIIRLVYHYRNSKTFDDDYEVRIVQRTVETRINNEVVFSTFPTPTQDELRRQFGFDD